MANRSTNSHGSHFTKGNTFVRSRPLRELMSPNRRNNGDRATKKAWAKKSAAIRESEHDLMPQGGKYRESSISATLMKSCDSVVLLDDPDASFDGIFDL